MDTFPSVGLEEIQEEAKRLSFEIMERSLSFKQMKIKTKAFLHLHNALKHLDGLIYLR